MSNVVVALNVDAGNPAVRIEVINSSLNLAAHAYGRLHAELPPGLYTVRYLAADARDERDVLLEPHAPVSLTDPPDITFASAVPLDLTRTMHQHHRDYAERLSRQPALERGHGAELFIFIRELEPSETGRLSQGLQVLNYDGALVADLTTESESCNDIALEHCEGRRISVDPGHYRLHLVREQTSALEMAIHACPGWQSQIFLLHRLPGASGEGSQAKFGLDFEDSAQLAAPISMGFLPQDRVTRRLEPEGAAYDLRLAELIRQALAHGRHGVARQDLSSLLEGSWQDPILGIMGLHLLLRRDAPDLDLAARVLHKLRCIIDGFGHPDLTALELEVAHRRREQPEAVTVKAPPLLRASWHLLVQASARFPDLIPAGSLAGRISDRLRGGGAWLLWNAPEVSDEHERPVGHLPQQLDAGALDTLTWTIKRRRALELGNIDETEGADRHQTEHFEQAIVKDIPEIDPVAPRTTRSIEQAAQGLVTDNTLEGKLLRFVLQAMGSSTNTMSAADASSDDTMLFSEPFELARAIRVVDPLGYLPSDQDALRVTLEALMSTLRNLLREMEIEELTARIRATDLESAMLSYLSWALHESDRPIRRRTTTDPISFPSMVTGLGLPASRVMASMVQLVIKTLGVIQNDSTGADILEEQNGDVDFMEAPDFVAAQTFLPNIGVVFDDDFPMADIWSVIEDEVSQEAYSNDLQTFIDELDGEAPVATRY